MRKLQIWTSFNGRILLAFLSVVLALAIIRAPLSSKLLANVARLKLNRATSLAQVDEQQVSDALGLFEKAMAMNANDKGSWLGAGIANVVMHDGQAAMASWREGAISADVLTAYGNTALDRNNLDAALIFYRGASEADLGDTDRGRALAGNVCQLAVGGNESLSADNNNYCDAYFINNDGNLIVNGQFEVDSFGGWQGRFFFAERQTASIDQDISIGKPAPATRIVGHTDALHNGLYQRIALQAGSVVRFSGWFRVKESGGVSARLLYIGWNQFNEPQGNHLRIATSDMQWTYMERTFRVPEGVDILRFYPVVLEGKATAWIDDVKLVLIEE